ncbi:MAG: Glu-tRNA(Gln) amidotransferase subunit GatD [Candidatus Diapherotrites archaeon]
MKAKEFMEKNKLKEGDNIIITKNNTTYEGTIIQPSTKNLEIIKIKLKSGYNIGIKCDEKTKVQKTGETKKIGKIETQKIIQNQNLPKVSILHTGGTIASRVDYRTGAVISTFEPEDLIAMFPEITTIANVNSKLLANIWSHDLRFSHIAKIAEEIKKEHEKGAKGIIVGTGTDNMAVAAAATAFTLEKCPLPIIFVGSQRSSDRPSTDAAMNLICATEFITKTDFAGVAICMHYTSSDDKCAILPACKTKKLHSSRRDAFKAINDTPIAIVDYKTRKIEMIKKNYQKATNEKPIIKTNFEEKVALFKIHINMSPEQFQFYLDNNYKGIVFEGTGLGHMPGNNPDKLAQEHNKIFPIIEKLDKKGCVMVMTTNTIYGRINMNVYNKGIDLMNLGIIPGEDMLPETAFVKLAWLLGNYKPEEAKKLIRKNLRGEITEFTKYY